MGGRLKSFIKKLKPKKLSFKRGVALFTAGLVTGSTLLASISVTPRVEAAGAKERVEAFIGLAAGKPDNNAETLTELTQDELQFLGVYLSNFYVPYGTELGISSTNTESIKTNMVQALSNNLNFSEDVAETIVDYVIGLSRANNRELEVRFSNVYRSNDERDYQSIDDFEVNYYTFMTCMMGAWDYKVIEEDGDGLGGIGGGINYEWDTYNPTFLTVQDYMSVNRRSFLDTYGAEFITSRLSPEYLLEMYTAHSSIIFDEPQCYCVYPSEDEDPSGEYPFHRPLTDMYHPDENTRWHKTPMDCMGDEYCVMCFLTQMWESSLLTPGEYEEISAAMDEYLEILTSPSRDWGGRPAEFHTREELNRVLNRTKFPYKYGYFGYTENGEFVPMFDFAINKYENTACQQVFAQCLMSVDMDNGYGTNFFDFTTEEMDSGMAEMYINLETISDDALYKMTAYGTKVRVDCFGNIIQMGVNHQYVIVPGCMNPYTWTNSQWNIHGVGNGAGTNIQLISAQELSFIDQDFDPYKMHYCFATGTENYAIGIGLAKGTKIMSPTDAYFLANKVNRSQKVICLFSEDDFNKACWSAAWKYVLSGTIYSSDIDTSYTQGYPWRVLRGNSATEFDGAESWFKGKLADWGFRDAHPGLKLLGKVYRGYANEIGPTYYWENGSAPENYEDYEDEYVRIRPSWAWGTGLGGPEVSAMEQLYYNILLGWKTYEKWQSYYCYDNMIVIDNLGAFGFDSSSSNIEYNAINAVAYIDNEGRPAVKYFENWSRDLNNGFTNMFSNISSGAMTTQMNISREATVSLYTTYAIAGLYTEDSIRETVNLLGYRMNRENLPAIKNEPILISADAAERIVNNNIRNWVYYVLHPTKGGQYLKTLIKTKMDAFLIGWHKDMVGANGVGITAGSTYFKTNFGYVTTPDLSEISWTKGIFDFYQSIIPILIIVMLVNMLLAYVTGHLSLQRAIIAFCAFTAFLFVPAAAINGVVEITNKFSTKIYGDKFVYWAVVQEETYGSGLDTYATGDSYDNYLRYLYSSNVANGGGQAIVLKWQAPKKMASLMLTERDSAIMNGLQGNLLNIALGRDTLSGESYTKGNLSYLYRDYSDIANFSRYIYHGIMVTHNKPVKTGVGGAQAMPYDLKMIDTFNGLYLGEYDNYLNQGYTGSMIGQSKDYHQCLRYIGPLNSEIYRRAVYSARGQVQSATQSTYFGINQDLFNFSLAQFNNRSVDFKESLMGNAKEGNDIEPYFNTYLDEDFTSLACYAVMSESPYYWFSWRMYDDGMSTAPNAYNGYKTMLLSTNNVGYNSYFYNYSTNGNGGMKDFMDMKGLFTYIIPYLKAGNDVVREWDDYYGVYVNEGVFTEEGHQADLDISGDAVLRQQYWHNLNVARLYEIYTPWIDLMYDCSYAQPEYIWYQGQKVLVSDPINPESYPVGRGMIFSESEMFDLGLTEADLTEVEKRILKCNTEMQESMFELLNYYNFSDLSLNSAAAIECTFAFNRNFSETGVLSSNINLYPQSFEVKDFSYDAFLRFILASSTGVDLASTSDFYEEIVVRSSTTTALILLILDILSQYVIPATKIFFLILIFVGSILMILTSVIKVDPQLKFIPKVLTEIIFPMLEYLAVTVIFAYAVSLFMGVGNNAVTNSKTYTISMGDPSVVLISMCVLDIVCLVLYFLIIKNVFTQIAANFKSVVAFEGGVVGGIASLAAGVVTGSALAGAIQKSSGTSAGGTRDVGEPNEEGTGREATSATERSANADTIDNFEEPIEGSTDVSELNPTEGSKSTDGMTSDQISSTIEGGKEKISHGGKSGGVMSDSAGERVSNLGEDLGGMTDSIGDKFGDVAEGASNVAENVTEKATEFASNVGEKASELGEKAAEIGEKVVEAGGEALEKATEVAGKVAEGAANAAEGAAETVSTIV